MMSMETCTGTCPHPRSEVELNIRNWERVDAGAKPRLRSDAKCTKEEKREHQAEHNTKGKNKIGGAEHRISYPSIFPKTLCKGSHPRTKTLFLDQTKHIKKNSRLKNPISADRLRTIVNLPPPALTSKNLTSGILNPAPRGIILLMFASHQQSP